MKICHVVESAGAGTGQIVTYLSKIQTAAGHDVTVIYSPVRAEEPFLQAISSIPGLTILTSTMQRSVGLHDLDHAFSLWRLLRQQKPFFDIIHGHSSKAGALVRLVCLFLPKCKVVYSPHGFVTVDSESSRAFKLIEWMLSFFCHALVATAACEKRHAVEVLGISEKKVHVVWNGTSFEKKGSRSASRQKLGYDNDVFLVGFVGRLAPQKNPHRMLDAFKLCLEKRPDLQLALLGDGEIRAEIKHRIATEKLGSNVKLFTKLWAQEYYCAFDVLLCPSNHESFGLVIVESMVEGVPVVTTPVGIADKAIIAGQTGWLGTFSPQSLADGVLAAAQLTPDQRNAMREACEKHVRKFSLEKMGAGMMALYESLLKKDRHS
ncbi:MAG: glycosyltransferase family 4 protein [Alphaproteobacteria bacterium]|nr:glycosyltransferase family 4 protein [Alphaproteobacteria bacterium]